MRTAVVVGAGATLAEALPGRLSQSELPPLDGTFFRLCRLARLPGRELVDSYMKATYGINPSDGGDHTMEHVFNYIHADASSLRPSDECLAAYWALTTMYAAAIRNTTNGLTGKSRNGVGALFRLLWRTDPTGEISFITFNQDLVIERSIEATAKTARYKAVPWNLRRCYRTEFEYTINHSNRPMFRYDANGPPGSSLSVLKLHGSLNWVYKVRSASDVKNAIRNPTTRPILYANQQLPASMKFKENQRLVDLLPLLVPPIFEKTPRLRQALLPIWKAAEDRLTRAERLIVFGYSFPDADFFARSLFRRSFHRNASLREIHVIDPAPAAAARVAVLTEPDCAHQYQSVEVLRRVLEPL